MSKVEINPTVARAQPEAQSQRAEASRAELIGRITRAISTDGKTEPLKGLHLSRISSVGPSFHGVSFPSVCVIAQGIKLVLRLQNPDKNAAVIG